ncbi:hypothetical protein [Altericroceibacterium spongiae]|nr:hypothetical protein [Altericroceibacterium spongiae]
MALLNVVLALFGSALRPFTGQFLAGLAKPEGGSPAFGIVHRGKDG